MLIAIEGMDGSGKTTIGKALADRLHYDFLEKALQKASEISLEEYIKFREGLKINTIANADIMAMFFAMNNLLCGNIGINTNVVSDRYITSNYFWYGTESNALIYDMILGLVGKPSLTVVLDVSTQALEERIKSRHYNCEEDRIRELEKVHNPVNFVTKSKSFLEQRELKYIIVKNENRTILDVVDEIVAYASCHLL